MEQSVTITALFRDGTNESVVLSALPIRRLAGFVELIGRPEMLETVLEKSADWVDRLTIESHSALVDALIELNLANARAFFYQTAVAVAKFTNLAKDASGIVYPNVSAPSPS